MIDENIYRDSEHPTCDEISCLLISWTHLLGGELPLVPDESPPEIFFLKFSFLVETVCTCSGRLNCLEKKDCWLARDVTGSSWWLTRGAGNSEGSEIIFTGGEGG